MDSPGICVFTPKVRALISLFSGDILEANRNLFSGSQLALVSMDHYVACNVEFV